MLTRLLLGLSVIVAPGCKDEDAGSDAEASASLAVGSDWSSRLSEPAVGDILAALAQPHRNVRAAIGPHRLAYEAAFELTPQPPREAPPAVEGKLVEAQAVQDTLSLVWAGEEEAGPRFSLSQSNEHERGRDIVVAQGQLYSRLRHRGWTAHPVETSIHELWLNDAQRAVHDVVELAAPNLDIATALRAGEGVDGDAVAVTLSAADGSDPERLAPGAPSQWRAQVTLDAISGELLVDKKSGAWLRAEVAVTYSTTGGDGRQLRGSVTLTGEVEPQGAQSAQVAVPADAAPLPERTRYELERARLLDGLAAP